MISIQAANFLNNYCYDFMTSSDSIQTHRGYCWHGRQKRWGGVSKYHNIGLYTVMQSDGNSLYGNVVSDSFNKTSRDEDNISDPIYVYI